MYSLLKLLVVDKLSNRTALVLSHCLNYVIALGVHRTIVKRILCTWYAQESCTLNVCNRTETGNLFQFGTRLKGTILVSILNDIFGCCSIKTADIHQQVTACRVEINANCVHTRLNNHIQALLQLGLVDIVLILSYTNTLRIYLHKLGKRVHKASAYGYSSTHRNVLIGKLLACCLRSRIDRSTVLANHKDINISAKSYLLQEGRRLTTCRTIAYSYCFYIILLYH